MSCPSRFERFTVTDFLPRLALAKYADSVVSLPDASFNHGGPKARESSPVLGRSILITSAPRSARFCPVHGAASTRDRSMTRIWHNGPAMASPSKMGSGTAAQILRLRYCDLVARLSINFVPLYLSRPTCAALSEPLYLHRLYRPLNRGLRLSANAAMPSR